MMQTLKENTYKWLDERLGLEDAIAFARKKTVPVHSQSFWYYWGGMSLFFYIIQVFTGVLLLVYYRPGKDAYESVRQITYQIHFGWLIRSAHAWAANLMMGAVFIHMFSVYFMKAYRKPREVGWFTGVALLLLTMLFGFSGYLLPMTSLSYFATKIGLEIPNALPLIGSHIADMVRGGKDVGEFTVQRFFALHAVILPLIFVPLMVVHVWLVQKHGNAVPPADEKIPEDMRRKVPFFPNFLLRDMAMWLIALNVLAVMASLFPWDLGEQANALQPAPIGIHPEWYYMSSFQTLKIFGNLLPGMAGEAVGMTLFTAGLVLWTVIPLYDKDVAWGVRARLAHYFGIATVVVLAGTTIWGYWGVR